MYVSSTIADHRILTTVHLQLPYRVRWQDLKDLFRKAGTVLRADVSLGPDNRSRGYGTVLMGSRDDAARAIGESFSTVDPELTDHHKTASMDTLGRPGH